MKKLFENWRRHLEEGNFRHPHGSGKPPSAVDKDTLHKKMAAARAGVEYVEPGSEEEKISARPEPRDLTRFRALLSSISSDLGALIELADTKNAWKSQAENAKPRLEDTLMKILDKHVPRLQEMAHEVGLAWAKPREGEEEYDRDAPPWGYPETARDPDESTARRYDDEERAIKRAGPSPQMSAKEHEKYMSLYDDDDFED